MLDEVAEGGELFLIFLEKLVDYLPEIVRHRTCQ